MLPDRNLVKLFSKKLHPAANGKRCRDSHPNIRRSWEDYRRIGRTEEPEEDMDSTRRPTELTNLNPWGLPETEPPTKEHTWAGPRPPTHM